MKHKLITLFVCLSYIVYSQDYVKEKSISAHSKNRLTVSALNQKNNGDIILSGVFNDNLCVGDFKIDSSQNDDLFILKLDDALNVKEYKHLSYEGKENINDMVVCPNGELIITGYFNNKAFGFKQKHGAYLIKLDSNYTIKSKLVLNKDFNNYIEKLHIDSLGNLYCIGKNKSSFVLNNMKIDSTNTHSIFILKLNSKLEVLKKWQYKSPKKIELLYSRIKANNLKISLAFEKSLKSKDTIYESDESMNSLCVTLLSEKEKAIEQAIYGKRIFVKENNFEIGGKENYSHKSNIRIDSTYFEEQSFVEYKDSYLMLESNKRFVDDKELNFYKYQQNSEFEKIDLRHYYQGKYLEKPQFVLDENLHFYIAETIYEEGKRTIQLSMYKSCDQFDFEELDSVYQFCEGEEMFIRLKQKDLWFVDSLGIFSKYMEINRADKYKLKTVNNFGCEEITDIVVNINKKPIILEEQITDASNPIISDGKISLEMDKEFYSFDWNSGDKKSAITNLKSGEYTVKIVDTATGCFVNKEFEIKDKESGVDYFRADFTRYQISNNKYQIHFKNTSYGDKLHYAWLIDGELKSRDKDFEYEFTSGIFEVSLLVSKSKIQLSMLAELSRSLSTKTQKLSFDTELFEADFDFRYLSDTKLGFRNLSTENLENPIWKFSDGSVYNQFELEKTFENSGIYEVELEVENIFGEKFSKKDQIIIGELTAQQVEQFKIIEDLKTKINKDGIDLLSYPNPMKTYSCMVYNLISDSKVKIELYNITGTKRILLQKEQMQEQGSHKLIYENKHNLQQGIYQLILTVDGVRYNFGLEVE